MLKRGGNTMAFNSAKRDEDCEARDARVTVIDSSPATARGEIGSCFSKSPQSAGVEIYRCSVAGRAVLRLFRFRPSGEQRSSGSVGSPSLNLSAKTRETARVVFLKQHVSFSLVTRRKGTLKRLALALFFLKTGSLITSACNNWSWCFEQLSFFMHRVFHLQ